MLTELSNVRQAENSHIDKWNILLIICNSFHYVDELPIQRRQTNGAFKPWNFPDHACILLKRCRWIVLFTNFLIAKIIGRLKVTWSANVRPFSRSPGSKSEVPWEQNCMTVACLNFFAGKLNVFQKAVLCANSNFNKILSLFSWTESQTPFR